jgi:hypothetical protein
MAAEDRQPSRPSNVADHVLQLDVHLCQRFLHVLDVLGRVGQEHRALSEVAAQHTDLVGRPERTREEAEGVETLDPLAIMDVACGAALDLLYLLRIDEEDLEATRLQEFKEWDPIDASGFLRDGRDATRGEPVRQGFQVGRVGAETAHRLGVITGRDRDKMGFGPDVNARSMQVSGRELRW